MKLDFYGMGVEIKSEHPDLMTRLQRDFLFFKTTASNPETSPHLTLVAIFGPPPPELISKGLLGRPTKNARIYQMDRVRLNDYYGSAYCVFDFKNSVATLFSADLDRLHEVASLCILSRVGKYLDEKGIHRIHAMGITKNQSALILTMPMKGGKTTLFLNTLTELKTQILSDDSPLISRNLEIFPFPIRVGVEPDTYQRLLGRSDIDRGQSYEIKRSKFGKKFLLPISAFKSSIPSETRFKRIILMSGKRNNRPEPSLSPSTFLVASSIVTGLVIGVGLPMMREYFIEDHWRDTLKLSRILYSRILTAVKLLLRAETYVLILGTDHQKNAELIQTLLQRPLCHQSKTFLFAE